MKRIIGIIVICLFVLMFNTSCEKLIDEKPFYCDTAIVVIHNPSDSLYVLYGYNTTVISDTIFPGESFISSYTGISSSSSQIFTMNTNSGGFTVEVSQCFMQFDAVNGYENLKSDCYDGKYQPSTGETDTDCGGSCKPCPPLKMPCTVAENYVDFTAISGLGADDDNLFSSRIESISYPVITNFELNNGVNFRVTIYLDSLPNKTRKFITGTAENEIRLILNTRTGTYYISDGQELYFVKISNGKYKLSFCDLDFYGGIANKHVLANGNMEFEY